MTSLAAPAPAAIPALPPAAAPAAIQTIGLIKRFGSRTAVDGLDLSIGRGSTYGLIGLNGSGKSTTIRMLMGLLAPTRGRILIDSLEMPAERTALMGRIGYVPDRPTAYPWMRVSEIIAFSSALRPTWDAVRAASMLAHYQLDPKQRIRKLSKGQGAKLSLLLALAHDPAILILDEPTDGLDPVARDDFLEHVLSSVCDKPRTVLMSSHNLADLQRIADTIGILHAGKLIVQRPTDELLATTKRLVAVLADPTIVPPAPPGTICTRKQGREWTLTILGSPESALATLRADPCVTQAELLDITLEDIFKDIIRGRQSQQEILP